jgi:hypothetical protein
MTTNAAATSLISGHFDFVNATPTGHPTASGTMPWLASAPQARKATLASVAGCGRPHAPCKGCAAAGVGVFKSKPAATVLFPESVETRSLVAGPLPVVVASTVVRWGGSGWRFSSDEELIDGLSSHTDIQCEEGNLLGLRLSGNFLA